MNFAQRIDYAKKYGDLMKKKSVQGAHFVYHCVVCRDIIVVECQCEGPVPDRLPCHATPKCKGKMLRHNRDPNMALPQTVYFYALKDNGNRGLELIEMPGFPRIDRLYLAIKTVLHNGRRSA